MNILQSIITLYRRNSHSTSSVSMKRIALAAAAVMLVSAAAHARPEPPATRHDLYVAYYRTIVADNDFHARYNSWRKQFPNYNWKTNGCSNPAKYTHYADNFYWPCVQHDFGYGNNQLVGQHNEATRKFIDDKFLEHMKQVCSHYAILAKPGCYGAANVFYLAVRAGGRSAF